MVGGARVSALIDISTAYADLQSVPPPATDDCHQHVFLVTWEESPEIELDSC